MSLLSEGQIKDYKRDGVILVKNLIDSRWQRKIAGAIEEVSKNKSVISKFISGKNNGDFFGDIDMWFKNDDFFEFMLHSPCASYAKEILGSKKVRHFYDQIFVKPAGCHLPTPWHHDITFWPVHLEKNNLCSIWITLDEVSKDSSGLEFIKGSHNWNKYWKSYAPGNDSLVSLDHEDLPDIDLLRDQHEFFSPNMKPGDALIFNAYIVHGASQNYSTNKPRRAFTSRWSDDKTVFENREKTKPILINHGLKTGDFLSGSLFPQVLPNTIEQEINIRKKGPFKINNAKIITSVIYKDFKNFLKDNFRKTFLLK